MPKKSRNTQQRARQEQWRRRVDAQVSGEPTRPVTSQRASSSAAVEDAPLDETEESTGYQQAQLRPMPANVTSSSASAATRSMNRTSGSTAMPTAGQRRAIAASRATRARMAMNTLSIEDEMHYVRADIRKLITLTVICLAIIIVLAFVLNM